jgi:GDP-4-dehydro-6-deoxy-D-mannose reductase
MEKVLILGINGFSGTNFQHYINKNELYQLYHFFGADIQISNSYENNVIENFQIDLSKYENLETLLLKIKPDYIINLIGIFHTQDYSTLLDINANLSQKLFQIIKLTKLNIKKILIIGSAAEYGKNLELPLKETSNFEPVNNYGLTKSFQTQLALFHAKIYSLNVCIARTFNIIGKGISKSLAIGAFIERIQNAKSGGTIQMGNPKTKRDYLDIEDVIDAYWKLLLNGKSGEIYNVCLGKSINIRELLLKMIEHTGKELAIETNPDWVKPNDLVDSYGDNSKIQKEINWKPEIDIDKSIKKLFD